MARCSLSLLDAPYIAQITINRPEKRNAFTPRTGGRPLLPRCCCGRNTGAETQTSTVEPFTFSLHHPPLLSSAAVSEMSWCFADAREDPEVGVVVLTGEGPLAFCSGGDQSVRGSGGYVGADGIPRLNVLDLQMQVGVVGAVGGVLGAGRSLLKRTAGPAAKAGTLAATRLAPIAG